MSTLPIIKPKELITILLKAGFIILRQKGSHVRLMHLYTHTYTTVSLHKKDLSKSMLLKILKQAQLSTDDFLRLLGK